MKTGVITDGISRDLARALDVMDESGLRHAELQFIWDKEIGDQTPEEIDKIKDLISQHDVKVSCLSRHIFAGLPVKETRVTDKVYQKHLDALARNLSIARELDAPLVRVMSGRKEMILFGSNGAEDWVVSNGAWEALLELMKPAVKLAEDEGSIIAVETGNNAMITTAWLGRKLIDDIGSEHLKLIWDIPNTMYATDVPYPDAYEEIKDGYLAHVHLKDCRINIARATVDFCALGTGDVAPYLEDIAAALKRDGYKGVVSLESVYRPPGGTFEDGFRECLPLFKKLFE